jgi:hypothetical protein
LSCVGCARGRSAGGLSGSANAFEEAVSGKFREPIAANHADVEVLVYRLERNTVEFAQAI